ncbi:Phytanoyl-CoA dioxygenase [Metarhizium rileyi]|uniref:Phytanoyl-CoA dioxygenase n=1 Tax=Metarhizium rileyi (strain RCEF 4871) TaxID=1649241 RepID=A0A167A551_METRR|nr:Phytanoyl-CoA dioxygenase [Metarhizium rileyi RCEF 4871]
MPELELSADQLNFYNDNGYLVLRAQDHALVSDAAELKTWADQVLNWPLEKGKWMRYFEVSASREKQPMRTENLVDYHEELKRLMCGAGLASILKQLTGQDMLLFKDKINHKLPNGNGFHAHVDYHGYSHVGEISHLTANFAIDEAKIENGCLEVVPGSHKMTIDFSNGGRISPGWEEAHQWTPVPLSPGDVLLFGSHLAHRSKGNNSDRSRTSLYATYYMAKDGDGLRQKYYDHRRKVFPPDYEREQGNDNQQVWKTYAYAAPFAST